MQFRKTKSRFGIAWLVVVLSGLAGARTGALGANPEFRGIWVSRFEWPNPVEATCKDYIDDVMQTLQDNNFNAVIFQMRGQADTLYPSPYEPWSQLISPTGADPGWDPMAYAINAAHAHGLEFHVYFNAHVAWQITAQPSSNDIFVDNAQPGFTTLSGTWGTTTANTTAYPTPTGDYRTRATTKTTTFGEVEWRPTLPADAWYEVSVWYPTATGGITNAQYTIDYADGSQTVSVNQQTNGNKWNVIGSIHPFVAGTTGRVRLSNTSTSTGTVFADAVRFRAVTPLDHNHLFYKHCNAADPAHRDWLIHDTVGPVQVGESNYVWIAPGVPAFQAYWRKQAMYLVNQYDGSDPVTRPAFDGMHFDRIRTPGIQYSYDPISEARRTGEGNPGGLDFDEWTRNQITRLLCDLYAQVSEVRPSIKLSSSPLGLYSQDRYPYPGYSSGFQYGYTKCHQDAQAWLAAGAQDFIVPMIYWGDGGNKPDYSEVLPDWILHNSGRHVYGGQTAGKVASTTDPLPVSELMRQIDFTRANGGQGNVVFSYSGVDNPPVSVPPFWSSYSDPGGPYEEPAAVPAMPWKDSPTTGIILGNITTSGTPVVDAQIERTDGNTVSLSSGDGLYSFLLVPPGTYTLTIRKTGLDTRTISGVTVAAGEVKRVNISLGPDYESDGDVDLDDFTHFRSCFNGPNRAPASTNCLDADGDQDGDVDLDDFTLFRTCYNGPNRPKNCP